MAPGFVSGTRTGREKVVNNKMNDEVINWQARDERSVWHPYTQSWTWRNDNPPVIEKAEGVWLTDVAGKRYLDAGASLWVTTYGHCEPRIIEAIRQQSSRLDHSTFFGATHSVGIELSEHLISTAPTSSSDWRALTKVFYGSDGASMVDAALKLAYQFSVQIGDPRELILHVDRSFHGDSIAASSIAGGQLLRQTYGPLLLDVQTTDSPAPHPGEDPAMAAARAEAKLAAILKNIGDRCCALIIEPMIQAAGGMYPYHSTFLQACRRLTDQYGILLICDEVAAGIARSGRMWATEFADIVPDVLLTGKGLSGGTLPISALLTTDHVASAFVGFEMGRTFYHGHTYAANPIACAAALENLRMAEELDFPRLATEKGLELGALLEPLRDHPGVSDIRRLGIMTGIEVMPKGPRAGFEICSRAQQLGLWMRSLGNVVVLMPPLSIDSDELHFLSTALTQAIDSTYA